MRFPGSDQTAFVGPSTISFSVSALRNPFSTKTTDSFRFSLFFEDQYAMASQNAGATFSVAQPGPFDHVKVIPLRKVNGMTTNYRF